MPVTSFALLLALLVTVHKLLGCEFSGLVSGTHNTLLYRPQISSQVKGYLGHGLEEGGACSLLPSAQPQKDTSNLTVEEVF